MKAQELREKYLEFFKSKDHKMIPSASLVPENDPSVLFTTAGIQPLVPYFMGESHPEGKRIVDTQKCLRTGDIDEVGDATHHTFFEMLGNWSLGDYFREESIQMSWEFLTSEKYLNLDKNRLAVSVFMGDENAPFDEEAYQIWKGIFEKENLPIDRIAKLPKENNWWEMEKGPCGPDSEFFYWVGDGEVPTNFNDDNDKWVEIWNNVFIQYEKSADGKYSPLAQHNIDTGMGLERTLAALNGLDDSYRTELFWPIIKKIEEISGKEYGEKTDEEYASNDEQCWVDMRKSMRIVADHIKAATMIIGDEKGIVPSNVDQGYVVRKLIRRAIRHGKILGINKNFTQEIAKVAIEIYREVYIEIGKNEEFILQEVEKEEDKFRETLDSGIEEFNKIYLQLTEDTDGKRHNKDAHIIPGDISFRLFSTYGFPLEIQTEMAKEKGMIVDEKGFNEEFKKHQDLSRTASAGKFKGGLADGGEETKKLHTVAHLMLEALRRVLGDHVVQKGSNITAERLRFDFSHSEKMTDEQKKEVEYLVNEQIEKNLPVKIEEMTLEEAKETGAMGAFESKYGEKVKVYSIGDFSKEICGGPHVESIGDLGHFRIKKEGSSSAGVRRIKAILE